MKFQFLISQKTKMKSNLGKYNLIPIKKKRKEEDLDFVSGLIKSDSFLNFVGYSDGFGTL
jgi:hypothetical protein